MNALSPAAFVGIPTLLLTAVAGISLGFLIAVLWTRSLRAPSTLNSLSLWKKIRDFCRESDPVVVEEKRTPTACKAASPCPLCLGHEDPAIGHLLARRGMVQGMEEDICERCLRSQRAFQEEIHEEIALLVVAGRELKPASSRMALSGAHLSDKDGSAPTERPEPPFRSKICPRCRERYHLARRVCGRDGEELVLLN